MFWNSDMGHILQSTRREVPTHNNESTVGGIEAASAGALKTVPNTKERNDPERYFQSIGKQQVETFQLQRMPMSPSHLRCRR